MDWKAIVIMGILPNVLLTLPLEFCCHDNKIVTDTLNVDLVQPVHPVFDSEIDAYIQYPPTQSTKSTNQVTLYEGTSCCNNDISETKDKDQSQTKPRVLPIVRRNKRFPIHLDPLYQYRYLARSGQCPTAKDGQPEFYCPTPDKMGNWRCIDDFQLCDGVRHCPNGEDELPVSCLFYRVVETHLHSVSQRLNSDQTLQRNPH